MPRSNIFCYRKSEHWRTKEFWGCNETAQYGSSLQREPLNAEAAGEASLVRAGGASFFLSVDLLCLKQVWAYRLQIVNFLLGNLLRSLLRTTVVILNKSVKHAFAFPFSALAFSLSLSSTEFHTNK